MNTNSGKDRDAKGARKRGPMASTYTTPTTSNPNGFRYTNDYASNVPYGPPHTHDQDGPTPFELYLYGPRSMSNNATHRSGSASHHHDDDDDDDNDDNDNNYSSGNEQYDEWLRQEKARKLARSGLSGSSEMDPYPHPSSTSNKTTHKSGSSSNHHHHSDKNKNKTSRKDPYEEWLRQHKAKELARSGRLLGSSGMNPHPRPSSSSSARSGGQRDGPYRNNNNFTPPSSMQMRVAPRSHSQAHGYDFDDRYAPPGYGPHPHAYGGGPWPVSSMHTHMRVDMEMVQSHSQPHGYYFDDRYAPPGYGPYPHAYGGGPGSSMHTHMRLEMEMVESQMDVNTQEAQDIGMMSPFEYMMHQMKTVKTKQRDTGRLGARSVGPSGNGTGSANANESEDEDEDEDFETEWDVSRDSSPEISPARFQGLSRKSRRDRDY